MENEPTPHSMPTERDSGSWRPGGTSYGSVSRGRQVPGAQSPRGPKWRPSLSPTNTSLGEQYAEFVAAVQFLSVLPVPSRSGRAPQSTQDASTSSQTRIGAAYFPIVGLIFSLLLWLVTWVLGFRLPHLALTALCVVGLVILTGGLHLDGLMDSCDGLLGGRARERKLEIMRDSRIGSFGVLGGICALLLKWAFLGSISGAHLVPSLMLTLVLGRWAMLLALYVFPNARTSGLGVSYRQVVTRGQVLQAGVISLVIALIAGTWLASGLGLLIGLLIWVCAGICALLFGNWINAQIGGLTGDSYGAIEELTEVVLLFVLALL